MLNAYAQVSGSQKKNCISVLPCSSPSAIMPKSCIICDAVASPDIMLHYCDQCLSALYCSRACQRKDWKKHKQICKRVNVGRGDIQVRTDDHTRRQAALQEVFEEGERSLDVGDKRFFKLFQDSTFEGSRAAALEMRKIVKPQNKQNQKWMLFHNLHFLAYSDSKMLSWPNSPLLVMLQPVDPDVLSPSGEENRNAPLHYVAHLADPFDYSTHENQLILAKQLIEHGADVNAVSIPQGECTRHATGPT
jgi:hypothetical protein